MGKIVWSSALFVDHQIRVFQLVASLAKVLAPARCRADKPGDDEKDDDGDASSLAFVTCVAAARVSVVRCKPHAWTV